MHRGFPKDIGLGNLIFGYVVTWPHWTGHVRKLMLSSLLNHASSIPTPYST